MKEKIVLTNSIGIDEQKNMIIHSPSRWSEGLQDNSRWFCYYPWELAYASSLLKATTDNHVKLIDPCLKKWDKEETLKNILEEDPAWLVIESSTRTIAENLWLAKTVKQLLGTKIVLVGQHASIYPESLISQGIDYVCIGEYEETLCELIKRRDSNIAGLYPNTGRNLIDIDKLPWPEDEDVHRIDYATPGEPSSEYAEIQAYASRGCLGNCTFCVARNIYYRKPAWRMRSPEDVVKEIEYLSRKYPSMEGIFFDEEAHNTDKNFVKILSSLIKDRKLDRLKYEAMCDIRFMDEDTMDAMQSAGYYKIRFGIETSSKSVAQAIQKPIDMGRVLVLLKYAQKIGLKTYATFMFGLPGSTQDSDSSTTHFIKNIIEKKLISNVQISIATPQPGTPFQAWAKERGFIVTNDARLYDGGSSVVLDYPWYSKKNIETEFKKSTMVRDHCFFIQNIRNNPVEFLLKRFKRYGCRMTAAKFARRLKNELAYLKFKK